MNSILIFTMLALFTVGVMLLQIYLSLKSCKWYGLVLPISNFLFSLHNVISISDVNDPILISSIFKNLLMANVSTVIMLVIYFDCRQRILRKVQKENME